MSKNSKESNSHDYRYLLPEGCGDLTHALVRPQSARMSRLNAMERLLEVFARHGMLDRAKRLRHDIAAVKREIRNVA
jgi:hypothetical protein